MARVDSRTAWRVPLVIVLAVLCVAAAVGGYALTWKLRDPVKQQAVAGIAVPRPLIAATATVPPTPLTSAPVPSPSGVSRTISAALADPALGPRVLVRVS